MFITSINIYLSMLLIYSFIFYDKQNWNYKENKGVFIDRLKGFRAESSSHFDRPSSPFKIV